MSINEARKIWLVGPVWSGCRTVTAKNMGSNPIRAANLLEAEVIVTSFGDTSLLQHIL